EYFHRKTRQYGWPLMELINKYLINEIPCLRTPVGYRLSDKRDYEWRIPFSLVKMELVKTLTKKPFVLHFIQIDL
ncbi:unnamed protein product, partial [Didymodactylos carnosus]